MTRRFVLVICLLLIPAFSFAQDSPDATFEFYGTVQSANATALVINGQIVDISEAQINAPLVAGLVVRIQGAFTSDGSIAAVQIDPVSPGLIPGIVEITGIVSELNETSIRVGAQSIEISSAHISGTPQVGQFVRAYALQAAPGVWTARSVIARLVPEVVVTPEVLPTTASNEIAAPGTTPEVIPPAQTPEVGVGEDLRIEGTLQAVDANSITVDGSRYFIGSARIDGVLTVGARVRLEIRVISGGEWIVEEVRMRDD